MGKIGVLANPASGKDVRRLVARASVFDNQEKRAIVRRAIVGALSTGGNEFVYHNDAHGITRGALEEFATDVRATTVDSTQMGSALDTISAARAMREAQCDVVITLGGDGTNRAFCLGWPDAPLLPISTGTNNVFPTLREATVAGAAAGLLASGQIGRDLLAQQKCISVAIEGERDDLALIDVLLTSERFVGARALLKPNQFRSALLTRAEPDAVGITSIGGLLHPVDSSADEGLWLEFGDGGDVVNAPIAPGLYQDISVRACQPLKLEKTVRCVGPGTLAFDGERERTLTDGQEAKLTLSRSGPMVMDVSAALYRAAEIGSFKR
jgi:hypothetical protein